MITAQDIENELSRASEEWKAAFRLLDNWDSSNRGHFIKHYHQWYAITHPIVQALAPERLDEFEAYLSAPKNRKSITHHTYTISDFLNGRIPIGAKDVPAPTTSTLFFNQICIVDAIGKRASGALRNLRGQVAAELEDAELEQARSLLKVNLRAAGAVAGVVLEGHLRGVLASHRISLGKKKPMLNNLNMALKAGGVLDQPKSRKIEHLGDLRNYCCHKKEREPTQDEVEELISGTSAIIKTVF